jgi:hypothetical protein
MHPGILAEVESDLNAQLDRVRAEMARLSRRHERALVLKEIYGSDPLTRERFNTLQTDIDEYPGRIAELREEERLLGRWLDRSRALREPGSPPAEQDR